MKIKTVSDKIKKRTKHLNKQTLNIINEKSGFQLKFTLSIIISNLPLSRPSKYKVVFINNPKGVCLI